MTDKPFEKEGPNLRVRGLVHDLNNLITVIRGNLTLAGEQLDDHDLAQSRLQAAEQAAGQLRPLISHLAAQQTPEQAKRATALEPLVRECISICLGASLVSGRVEVEADLPAAAMERASLARILNNLFINAKEAMPEGGTVVARLSRLQLGDAQLEQLPEGNYISIEVTDNGPGIPEESISRVFDPYYSSKLWGQGLGLAASRVLAEQAGGTLRVRSKAEQGACFELILLAVKGS
jgi:signal transduction histidine kinase